MISVIIVTGKVFHCFFRTMSLKHAIWEQFDYYNQKQNKVLYVNMENMDFLPPTALSLVFALETYTSYSTLVFDTHQSTVQWWHEAAGCLLLLCQRCTARQGTGIAKVPIHVHYVLVARILFYSRESTIYCTCGNFQRGNCWIFRVDRGENMSVLRIHFKLEMWYCVYRLVASCVEIFIYRTLLDTLCVPEAYL